MSLDVPCPHCGETVDRKAAFCRHCGSDRKTGWAPQEEIDYRSVELPEADPGPVDGGRFVRFVVIVVLIAMLLWILSGIFF